MFNNINYFLSLLKIGNIKELHSQLQRWEHFLLELPSHIQQVPKKLMDKRNEMIAKKRVEKYKNKMESGDYPKAPFQPKVLAVLFVPFVPVLLWFLYAFISSMVFFVYMTAIFIYFSILVGMSR